MRIAIVTSRLCDSGDQLALRRFVCCEPNGPEYAMDVQRYIRGLRVKDEPGMYRMVLQYGETPNAPIVGFCEFGYDAARHGRTPYVLTQIDPRNEASVHLFSGAGFENEGRDENDPEFDIWSKEFEPLATDRLYFYSPIMIDEDDKN